MTGPSTRITGVRPTLCRNLTRRAASAVAVSGEQPARRAGDIERVYAEAATHEVVGTGPDATVGTARFVSGAVGALDHNWILPYKTGLRTDHRLAVFGTDGSAYVETRDTPAVIFAGDGVNYVHSTYYSYPNDMPFGAVPAEDAFFLANVRDGRPWPLSVADARAALVAALAMDRSVAEGRPVHLSEIATI